MKQRNGHQGSDVWMMDAKLGLSMLDPSTVLFVFPFYSFSFYKTWYMFFLYVSVLVP